MTPDEEDELKRLRRENARLKEDNEILRKAAAVIMHLDCRGHLGDLGSLDEHIAWSKSPMAGVHGPWSG
jgi:hypothetical protein